MAAQPLCPLATPLAKMSPLAPASRLARATAGIKDEQATYWNKQRISDILNAGDGEPRCSQNKAF